MTTRLVLLRHGETALNAQNVFQGQFDEPLSDVGREQARRAAVGLTRLRPDVIYCSDLTRARQTADEVAALTGLEPRMDPRLREIDCGSWSGRSVAEISAEFPEFAALASAGMDFRRSPTGETEDEVAARVAPALGECLAFHRDQTVLVVGHGLAIRVAIARLLGWPVEAGPTLGTMLNCHYATVLDTGRRRRLAAYNVPSEAAGTGPDVQPAQ